MNFGAGAVRFGGKIMKKIIAMIISTMLLLTACGEKVYAGTDIAEEFDGIKISLHMPEGWNYRAVRSDEVFELQHQGIQLFDGDIPEQKEMYDGELFVAVAANGHAESYIESLGEASEKEITEEKLVTSKGYNLRIISADGLPEYAVFEDLPEMCIFFDTDSDGLGMIYNIINTINIEKE